jgi:hypothetical protein
MRILINETAFGIWNAFSGGAPAQIMAQQNLGTAEGWRDSTIIGVTSFTNLLSLGFQNSIRDSIGREQEEMFDMLWEAGYDPTDLTSGIAVGLLGTLAGIGSGIAENIYNFLPIDEIAILMDPNTTSANRWGAGFSAISKVANLAALGAGVRQNAKYFDNSKTSPHALELLTAKGAKPELSAAKSTFGYFLGKKFHSAIYFRTGRKMVAERGGGGSEYYSVGARPRTYGPGETWREPYFDFRRIHLSKQQMTKAREFARSQKGDPEFHFYKKNCSAFANDLLRAAEVPDVLYSSRLAPQLMKLNIEHMNYLKGLKAALIDNSERSQVKSPAEKN